jgi:predicted TIM-barrel fold metal-dependent hydrolase
MVATLHDKVGAETGVDNLVLVSSDTHIGPLLSQLRDYCPKAYLQRFDDFVADIERSRNAIASVYRGADDAVRDMGAEAKERIKRGGPDDPLVQQMLRNRQTPGHHDMHARLRDMNRDGLTGEIIFHGSQNGEPIPFVAAHDLPAGLTTPFTFEGIDPELAAVGVHIYNQWLADVVSIEPDRHVGLAQIPAWDPAAAAKEAEWAADHGLRGLNFPAWRPGMPVLQDDAWEPLFALCNERGLPLTNHGGAGDDRAWPAAEGTALRFMESPYHSKRLIWSLAFHGVFEDYPDLKLMIAEIPGDWWPALMQEMDSVKAQGAVFTPKKPSEYCANNVFHGATFMSHDEALSAVTEGYYTNIMWGSDYPHVEGTWQLPGGDDEEPQTHLALRDTFADIAIDKVRRMAGLNAIDVYGLDGAKLQQVANRICAPSPDEMATPLPDSDVPEVHGMFVFRKIGPWA